MRKIILLIAVIWLVFTMVVVAQDQNDNNVDIHQLHHPVAETQSDNDMAGMSMAEHHAIVMQGMNQKQMIEYMQKNMTGINMLDKHAKMMQGMNQQQMMEYMQKNMVE